MKETPRGRQQGERLAWTLVAPLLALASLAGHQAGYALAIRDPRTRADALAHDGHGYLAYLPVATGALVVLAVLAVALRARGRGRAGLPLWAAAALPPLGFIAQEHVERLLGHHGAPLVALGEPAFLVGLALQLPFAGLALLLAQRLQRFADALSVPPRAPQPRATAPVLPVPNAAPLIRLRPLALSCSLRGPPAARQ